MDRFASKVILKLWIKRGRSLGSVDGRLSRSAAAAIQRIRRFAMEPISDRASSVPPARAIFRLPLQSREETTHPKVRLSHRETEGGFATFLSKRLLTIWIHERYCIK